MSDSVQPHRWQPTRLPRPWDSPGRNTGVGCHFLHQCMKVKSESEVTQSCLTLSNPMGCSLPGSSVHGIFQARVLEWVAIAFFDMLRKWPQFFPAPFTNKLIFCQWITTLFTQVSLSLEIIYPQKSYELAIISMVISWPEWYSELMSQ